MKTRWLDRTLIQGPRIALCKSEKQYLETMRELGVDDPDRWINEGQVALVHHFSSRTFGGRTCVVCVSEMKGWDAIEVAATLVHEAVHIWQAHVEFLDEVNPSKEFEAYSIEKIAYNLMKAYVKC